MMAAAQEIGADLLMLLPPDWAGSSEPEQSLPVKGHGSAGREFFE